MIKQPRICDTCVAELERAIAEHAKPSGMWHARYCESQSSVVLLHAVAGQVVEIDIRAPFDGPTASRYLERLRAAIAENSNQVLQ